MSLSMIVELVYASKAEARLIVEAARRAGGSVRLQRWGYHACVDPIAEIEDAHEALTDEADLGAET